MSEPAGEGDVLNMREQLARIDNLLASTQKRLREHSNIEADTEVKRRSYELAPWQVVATVFGGGAAFFAAGAAFVKLVGG